MTRTLLALSTLLLCAAAMARPGGPYDVVSLGNGIYTVQWRDRPINTEPNDLIIVNDDDVVVVDTNLLPSTARAMVAEIRKITPKPVRYVVNTHWHDDHVLGNWIFREAWPGVEFIAHPNTRTDAASKAFGSYDVVIEDDRKQIVEVEKMLQGGKRPDGTPLSEASKKHLESVLEWFHAFVAERPSVKTVLPDVLVTDTLILQRGARTIEVHYLGRGNTRGDVVVYLPKEKILATGDLVVAPTPFGLGSYYRDWIATLDRLMELDATTLVLAHGPIQHDYSYVKNERGLLEALVTRVGDEVAKGASLDDVKKNVTLADWREKLAGDDKVAGRGFDEFFVAPAVERTYHQAKGDPDDAQ
jgi:cyclase